MGVRHVLESKRHYKQSKSLRKGPGTFLFLLKNNKAKNLGVTTFTVKRNKVYRVEIAHYSILLKRNFPNLCINFVKRNVHEPYFFKLSYVVRTLTTKGIQDGDPHF